MNVVVTPDGVTLTDPEDLGRLSVTAPGSLSHDSLDATLRSAAIGKVEGEHASLYIDDLRSRRHALGFSDDDAFDGMIRYATEKGWTAADGSTVRAHVERTDDQVR